MKSFNHFREVTKMITLSDSDRHKTHTIICIKELNFTSYDIKIYNGVMLLNDDYNINVQIIDFGNSIPATVTINDDGSFSIFLNARLSYERRLEAYWHEMRHIQNQDFYGDMSVDEMEAVNKH